ncbi:MAG: hypothetical protein C0518_11805 [Opitutus sp.]|nr:hypothetical protein [Opitutus sp.]
MRRIFDLSFNSLRGRLLVLGAMVVLSALLLATSLTWSAYNDQRDALARDLQNTSRAVAAFVEQEMTGTAKLLRTLAASPSLASGDLAAFYERAGAVTVAGERWIIVLAPDGRQLVNTRLPIGSPLPATEISAAAREAWMRGQPFVSNLTPGGSTQSPVLAVSVPQFVNGEFHYAVLQVMTPAAFVTDLDLPQIAPGYVLNIVDRSGTTVARTPSGERYVGRKAMPDIVAAAVAQKPFLARSKTLEGIEVLSAVSPAPFSGYAVALGAPMAVLRAASWRLVRLSALVTFATVLITAALIWSISRAVVGDVEALESSAEAFGRGQAPPDHRWNMIETATIARAMRRTADRLHQELRERTVAEAALRVVEQRFRLATTSDEITLFEQDADLRYTWLYPEHPEHRHALGRTDIELAGQREAEPRVTLKRAVMATGEARRGEVTAAFANGVRHYSLFVTPRRATSGEIVGVAGVAFDITLRKQTEQALTRAQHDLLLANAELESKVRERTAAMTELLRQMEEFTYSVSHDLRAPIRAMTVYSGVLLEDHAERLGPEGRTALERIVGNGQKMDRLINDLLTFSRVSREVVEVKPLSLRDAVHDAVREVQHRWPGAVFELPVALPGVLAQPTLLAQALVNLLDNAAKFVAPGTRPQVKITAEERPRRVRLFVRDNGIGIKPELHARLFRVFERLHSQGYDGTGIGLAIVRRAMERMGGAVGIESDGRHGSAFWIELPTAFVAGAATRTTERFEETGPVGHA